MCFSEWAFGISERRHMRMFLRTFHAKIIVRKCLHTSCNFTHEAWKPKKNKSIFTALEDVRPEAIAWIISWFRACDNNHNNSKTNDRCSWFRVRNMKQKFKNKLLIGDGSVPWLVNGFVNRHQRNKLTSALIGFFIQSWHNMFWTERKTNIKFLWTCFLSIWTICNSIWSLKTVWEHH